MTTRALFPILAFLAATPALRAQDAVPSSPGRRGWRWQGGGGVRYTVPMSTMSEYFVPGRGIAVSMRAAREGSPFVLTGDAEYLHFGDHTASKPYNGTGPAVAITSAADILLIGAGPGLVLRKGRFHAGVQAGAGVAYTHAAGRTASGTSPQNDRANTYTTLTWQVQGGAALGVRLGGSPGAARLELSGRVVHAGETDFLREYNLPVGVISGLYINPTPYAPTFAVFALTVTATL
jgi:hypothetical protein